MKKLTCRQCKYMDLLTNYSSVGHSPINRCVKHCSHREDDQPICEDFVIDDWCKEE